MTDPAHFVSSKPFEPNLVEQLTPTQERYYKASQTRLMWWKFRANRLALFSGALLLLCSDAGAWITGQVIHIDGGWVIRP